MSSEASTDTNRELNNPAGRLLVAARAFKKRFDKLPQENQDQTKCEDALYELFEIKKGDRSSLLATLSCALALPHQIREEVARYDNDLSAEILLKWVPKVEQIFTSLNMSGRYRDFAKQFDDTTMYGMEICADFLSRRAPEKILTGSQIAELSSEIEDTRQTIIASDMPDELKIFILNHVESVAKALREYRLSGTLPLENALNAAVGAAITQHDVAKQTFQRPEGKKAWDLLSKIHIIVGATWTTMQIGDKAGNWIVEIFKQ